MQQTATDEQEREMLTQLNPQLLADYYMIKEKGDDVRVYTNERQFVPNKEQLNDQNQLVLSKNTKITLAKPKQQFKQFEYKLNNKGLLVVSQIKGQNEV